MPVIVVANSQGGTGKSTLATNVADCLAAAGHALMLGDVDRQKSSRQWLALRPESLPTIQGWKVTDEYLVKPPEGMTHVGLDS